MATVTTEWTATDRITLETDLAYQELVENLTDFLTTSRGKQPISDREMRRRVSRVAAHLRVSPLAVLQLATRAAELQLLAERHGVRMS